MLEPYQQKIIDENKHKALIALDRGMGKTLTNLALCQDGITLVICKKKQKDDKTFENEVSKFNLNVNLTTITHDIFAKKCKTLPYFDNIIIDEADDMLNGQPMVWKGKKYFKKTARLKSILWYIDFHKPKRVYPASATIIRNPYIVFNTARILGIQINETEFIDTYYYVKNQTLKIDWKKYDKLIALARSLGYTGSHEKYKNVPPQIEIPIFVPLTDEQIEYNKLVDNKYTNERVALSKKYQVHNGLLLGNQFEETVYIKNNKEQVILDLAKKHPRMIIFAQHTEQINILVELLKDYKLFVLTGKTKQSGKMNEEAKNTDEYIYIAQSTISAGWELPECPVTVFASGWVADDTIQGEGRIQRSHNLKENTYYYIMTDTSIDRALYNRLLMKKEFYKKLHE